MGAWQNRPDEVGGRPASWNSVPAGWAAAVGGRRRVERGSEVFVIAARLQVRILARQSAIVRVQANRAAQVIDGFVRPSAHPERDRHDVVSVIALRILAECALEMVQGASVIARIEGDRRGVDPLCRRFGSRRLPRGLSLADTEIEPGAFEQFPFLRVAIENGAKEPGGPVVVVALEGLHATLVNGNRLVESGFPGDDRRGRRLGGGLRDGPLGARCRCRRGLAAAILPRGLPGRYRLRGGSLLPRGL